MSKIGLVIGREYTSRVKKKSFLILTILVPLLVAGMGFLAVWLGMENEKHQRVLISDPRNLCDAKIYVSQDENPPATFYFTEEMVYREDFENLEKYKDYDVFIALDPDVITNKTISGVTREKLSSNTHRYIAKKLEMRLEEYFAIDEGIPIDTYRKIKQSYKFETFLVGEDPADAGCNPEEIGQGVGLGFSVMIYIFLMVYGGMVMRGVMEEKQGRVVEVIVSSVRPFDLMLGKIIGIGLVGLTQFFIWFVVVTAVMLFVQPLLIGEMAATPEMGAGMIPEDVAAQMSEMNCVYAALYDYINWPMLIVMFVVYFIGGYLLYGSLFAIVGAAADSEADTQQLVIPIMIPLTFVYILSFSMIGDPESATALWGSHVPLSSPIIMLQRIGSGTVAFWEVLISLIILTGTFIFTTYLAGKVYRVGILMYGKKVTWKEIIKWMKHK